MAADADRDGYADDNQECEPVLIADGDRRHADGCDDLNCEEIDAPGRSELSWPCWVVWSDET